MLDIARKNIRPPPIRAKMLRVAQEDGGGEEQDMEDIDQISDGEEDDDEEEDDDIEEDDDDDDEEDDDDDDEDEEDDDEDDNAIQAESRKPQAKSRLRRGPGDVCLGDMGQVRVFLLPLVFSTKSCFADSFS